MAELGPSHAPAVPGLRVRTYAGPEDVPDMVTLAAAAMRANGVGWTWTRESLAHELANPTHADPGRDVFLAFMGERLVGWSQTDWVDSNEGERLYWAVGHVHPDWRRRGVGAALLRRDERRRREVAATHDTAKPRLLVSWVEDPDVGARELLAANGYQRARTYYHMVRPDLDDIDLPELPPGIDVRPVTDADLPRIWAAIAEAFRDHFGEHDVSDAAFRRWSGDPDFDPELLVVAYDGDEVAAGVQGSINAAENAANGYLRGWADPVFTRRTWRRRGLASALLGRALVRLRERGMTSAQLDVDSENPNRALGLYERHRFVADHTSSEWRKPLVS
jgi:mycothiol synthase